MAFRVALSYPGEYRALVEKIAEALARRLPRDQIFYDQWYAFDSARPNLSTHLTGHYRDAELLVFFLCKLHTEKDWTSLEWRDALDRILRKQHHTLVLLIVDDIKIEDVPGLRSSDGCLDIRHLDPETVAEGILSRLPNTPPKTHRTFTAQFPTVNPLLIGREDELALLDHAWANPATNFVQIVAAGGTGKTALVDKFFRAHLGEADVFAWSFGSQGASTDRQTSSDPFFAELSAWLHIDIAPTASIYAKVDAVADRLRRNRRLLILDGVEPLQEPAGPLRDAALKALLKELDTENQGLVVCTTRVPMEIPGLTLNLDNLTPEQGAQYLRTLSIEGSEAELQKASREYGNHALALTLLGTWLSEEFHKPDISHRIEIPKLTSEDAHAQRMIAAYELMFAGQPELDILKALGYFDRPAEPEALKLVLPPIAHYQRALNRLHKARLILTNDPTQPLDCHPLIREHFAPQATKEGHAKLYEHYKRREDLPSLCYAVHHGCLAGKHQEARRDVYRDRIQRGGQYYLDNVLGEFGTNLSLLANFFEVLWIQPVASLTPADQSWLIAEAGFTLRALGRLSDAVGPVQASAEAYAKSENWKNAAIAYSNLSQLHLTLGNISDSIVAARQSVEFADRSGVEFQKESKRTTFADALHQSGDQAEALRLFQEAERIKGSILSSLPGYQCCDLLLSQREVAEVLRRASQTLPIAEQNHWLLDIGLDHISLGCAHPRNSPESAHHLNQAVEFLRRAGQLDRLPRALLARGTPHDLEEVFRIATRSGMRLYLADYHLAKGNLAEAERLINETGYHRRDPDLARLRAQLSK